MSTTRLRCLEWLIGLRESMGKQVIQDSSLFRDCSNLRPTTTLLLRMIVRKTVKLRIEGMVIAWSMPSRNYIPTMPYPPLKNHLLSPLKELFRSKAQISLKISSIWVMMLNFWKEARLKEQKSLSPMKAFQSAYNRAFQTIQTLAALEMQPWSQRMRLLTTQKAFLGPWPKDSSLSLVAAPKLSDQLARTKKMCWAQLQRMTVPSSIESPLKNVLWFIDFPICAWHQALPKRPTLLSLLWCVF